MLPSSQLRDVTIKDYLVILKRRAWVIFACFFIVGTISTIQTMRKVPLYKAIAKILIERSTPQIAPNIQQVYSSPYYIDREFIQNQIDILYSRSLAREVLKELTSSGDTTFMNRGEPELSFLGGVNVYPTPGSNILNIAYIFPDPVKASRYANALTNTYIRQDIEKRTAATKTATGWLEKELLSLKGKLESSENALNDYLLNNKIVSVTNVEHQVQGSIDRLKQEKISLENQVSELGKRYKPKHPTMISLRSKISALEQSISDETGKFLELNAKMVQYGVLKREVESNRFLYESLLRRIKETEVTTDLQTTNITIVDLANVPKGPFSPNRKRDIYTGAAIGFFIGICLAFLIEYLDSTVKNAEDIEAYVKLPFLGYVPSAKNDVKTGKEIDVICSKLPESRVAEAYRSIRTSIIFSSTEDKPLKSILITSSTPEEGKTTVSLNLGIVFASANEKTLVIEADMRRPRIGKSLSLESPLGLSSYLAGTSDLESSVQKTFIPNLFIMTSGPRPPNPAELLTSSKARQLIEEAQTKFDRVLLDSSPVLTVADSAILANKVDGVIDVVRASFQNIDLILRGRQRLVEAKARIVGVILNNVNVRKEDSYYYYHYYYSSDDPTKKKG